MKQIVNLFGGHKRLAEEVNYREKDWEQEISVDVGY